MDRSRMERVYGIARELAPRLPYHNFGHLVDVSECCRAYARLEGLGETEAEVLGTACLLHDIVYVPGRRDNEERSAELSRRILSGSGYSSGEIAGVSETILFTKYEREPRNACERIIHDSDLDSLGRGDFLEKTELLRIEGGLDRERWYKEIEPDFLSKMRYYTPSARRLRGQGLRENLERLEELVW